MTLATTNTPGDSCTIDFTANVLRAPSQDARPLIPGLQTIALAEMDIVTVMSPFLTGGGDGSAIVTILLAQPAIATQATSATVGQSIGDTATVSSLVNPIAGPGAGR